MALVGASGAVGREMLSILAQAGVAAQDMHLFGSRSAGSSIPYGGSELVVADLAGNSFDDVDVVLFAADTSASAAASSR